MKIHKIEKTINGVKQEVEYNIPLRLGKSYLKSNEFGYYWIEGINKEYLEELFNSIKDVLEKEKEDEEWYCDDCDRNYREIGFHCEDERCVIHHNLYT